MEQNSIKNTFLKFNTIIITVIAIILLTACVILINQIVINPDSNLITDPNEINTNQTKFDEETKAHLLLLKTSVDNNQMSNPLPTGRIDPFSNPTE